MKTSLRRGLFLIGALACCSVTMPSALAQATTQVTPTSTATGPAKPIGPPPANTPQHDIITSALSTETRETLQKAMNSEPATASTTKPANK